MNVRGIEAKRTGTDLRVPWLVTVERVLFEMSLGHDLTNLHPDLLLPLCTVSKLFKVLELPTEIWTFCYKIQDSLASSRKVVSQNPHFFS
jgi:hypothetical protein